jgi:hypothetical protein
MPTLNMDMEIAKQATSRMEMAFTTMNDEMKRIRFQVYSTLQDNGNWMGFSANEFFKEFTAIDVDFDRRLKEFGMIGEFLRQEVDQWIAMQEHLSNSESQ